MKNKRIIITIMAAVLVAVIGVGATLAYFTDSDEAKNVLTLGAVVKRSSGIHLCKACKCTALPFPLPGNH